MQLLALLLLVSATWGLDSRPLSIETGVDGATWGVDFDAFRTSKPKPVAVIAISKNTMVVSFSVNRSYRFEDRKLAGVYFGNILDWDIASEMNGGMHGEIGPMFDGLSSGMNYNEVRAVFGDKMAEKPDYRSTVILPNVTIHLSFSSSDMGGSRTFSLNSVKVRVTNLDAKSGIDVGKESGLF